MNLQDVFFGVTGRKYETPANEPDKRIMDIIARTLSVVYLNGIKPKSGEDSSCLTMIDPKGKEETIFTAVKVYLEGDVMEVSYLDGKYHRATRYHEVQRISDNEYSYRYREELQSTYQG